MRRQKVKGNPFFSSKTLIYRIFSMAMVGTKIKRIEKFCKKVGSGGFTTYLRILRSGAHQGRTWTVEERHGEIKVTPNKEVIPREKRKNKHKI